MEPDEREYARWVGAHVTRLRKQLGLTQAELATKVGLEEASSLQRIEHGRRPPSFKRLVALARELKVPASVLLTPTVPNPPQSGRPRGRS